MRWWIAVTTLLVTAACSTTPLILTDSDSGATVVLTSGDRFELHLASNPSTGYQWLWDGEPHDVVDLLDERFVSSDSALVGEPGSEVFDFEARTSGAGIVRLTYVRPFDDPPVPEGVVEFIVEVDGVSWAP